MGILSRFKALQKAARQRAICRRLEQTANAEGQLALDDQSFHGLSDKATVELLEKRLGLSNRGIGYRADFHQEGDDDD
jgi:hypothetical protein